MIRLNQLRVPYSYRYFPPQYMPEKLKLLIPDYAPEFVLPHYKVVIVVQGEFFGNIPSVIARNVLAKTMLENEGWSFHTFHQIDILRDLNKLFHGIPALRNKSVRGGQIPNPYAESLPAIMERFYSMQRKIPRYISANARVERRDVSGRVRNRGSRHSLRRRTRDRSTERGGWRGKQPRRRG